MSDRKKDHIDLALNLESLKHDKRFWYEPMLAPLNTLNKSFEVNIAEKKMHFPLWISSMTGGTHRAKTINQNLAKACREFGLGFGLGSCRSLFESDQYFKDFNMRSLIGDQQPFFGNIGIAQLESYLRENRGHEFKELKNRLALDGWIVHINPLQEWTQPEGDLYLNSPLETIKSFLEIADYPVMVKEVGHGFGPKSLTALLELPLTGIELAGFGGTNFTLIEQARQDESFRDKNRATLGQTNTDMLKIINQWADQAKDYPMIIFSGGIKSSLDGYFFNQSCKIPSLYAQAGMLLKFALAGEKPLFDYIKDQIELYQFANQFLTIREGNQL